MNVLIVHAHPEPKSFSGALMRTAFEEFTSQGHSVLISDLYAMKWNPVASSGDFCRRTNKDYLVYAMEQRHNYENGSLAGDVAAEIEKVKWCDLLVFNFPIYWFSEPAILKGWIDRVMVSGLFYGGRRIYSAGGMRGKRAMVTVTLGGREHMFGPKAIHGELEVMLRPLLQGTFGYCGFDVLPPFAAYHVPYVSDYSRNEILNEYRLWLGGLDLLMPLGMPSLEHFDQELRPL